MVEGTNTVKLCLWGGGGGGGGLEGLAGEPELCLGTEAKDRECVLLRAVLPTLS